MITNIKALTFDTGGTILDWHSGLCGAFQKIGERHGVSLDWDEVTNDYRRLAMKGIVGQMQPAFNMDDVHRAALNEVLAKYSLQQFSQQDREHIFQAWHQLTAWPDFPPALARIRKKLPAISFTMLPLSLVLDVSRKNDLDWDAVISCEMIGIYKPNSQAYLKTAQWLGLEPAEILMVACHNFDLNAARACGFKTAFVRRPAEWGPAGPPDPTPHPDCNRVVDDFVALADQLGV
ncbi:haloacid dehalogenase type II [Rhodoferax sp.]|uniref:haloacid dehalogenase type II n=1 Tax=Rhodoferax sp. TaxID=50421 RepID=UPI002633A78C|nr:haloacid dehalogenase type II [Rhodoferax sp.]MDD2919502.1 haloacid dehalogenase type II [Rhodoferax sp.]